MLLNVLASRTTFAGATTATTVVMTPAIHLWVSVTAAAAAAADRGSRSGEFYPNFSG